ncbi:hydroxymethylpyrimidine/phosphomethylpyrimidine kinase [Dokdonia sp. Dokd-P16]|uniref:hydroxymethylpyrimidine/phosphomethylpyrimidine kinase n=1 Tax=Dokdonia sp. Dokd-P16 TaxID=2173169 RepID=UPI000D5480FB|nr:hydroxymethylpyrimidine/phosphomethylpyrimidine kinase [Dokdonia sp. Dokd-P16]AWH75224.1 hydroxymethylpyrimidine/phosphomethylpyrimidine kinase [Dokdonia sp. Dokd-P16]
MKTNNYILTIAGLDPSSGAGITSDIKTFEAHQLYGLSVCTAVTVQNDINFKECVWINKAVIISQIETLFERFEITVVKIGIIESWEVLSLVLDKLQMLNPEIKIIVDPIIKASAGFDFHSLEHQDILDKIWSQCYIITPNYDEIQLLYPDLNIEETIEHISSLTNIHLKGGHRKDKTGWDVIYHSKTVVKRIAPKAKKVLQKHGSGCVLSAALASNMMLGQNIEEASMNAKYYTETFLNSTDNLLGQHSYPIMKIKS